MAGLADDSTILSGDIIPPDGGGNPSEDEPKPSSPTGQLGGYTSSDLIPPSLPRQKHAKLLPCIQIPVITCNLFTCILKSTNRIQWPPMVRTHPYE